MNRPVCVLQTQLQSLSATIGIRVPEVAVGGRWRPDAVGLPALRRERLRVEAGVLQMREGVLQIMRIVSITSAI